MKLLGARILYRRIALHDRTHDPTALERLLNEPDRRGTPNRQRRHRLRKNYRTAQRQNPQHVGDVEFFFVALASHGSPFEPRTDRRA